MPATAPSSLFGHHRDDVLDLAAAVLDEQPRKAPILQVATEQGANPGAGDAEGVAGSSVVGQDEDIAEQLAHRAGLDRAAVGRALSRTFLIPIREKLLV